MNSHLPGSAQPQLLSSSKAQGAGAISSPAPGPRTLREEWRDPGFRSDCVFAIVILLIILIGVISAG